MSKACGSATEKLRNLSREKAELLKLLLEKSSREMTRIQRFPRNERSVKARAPASWAQQRLWFIDQFEGGSVAYHVPLGLRLRGGLDLPALQKTLDAIVQRHESLRTVLVNEDGDPQQEISPHGSFSLRVVDPGGYGAMERDAQLRLHAHQEAHAPFDLRLGPLIRGRLLRLGDQEYVLLVTMHHIVSDGWSIAVFMRELAALYAAYHEGGSSPLAPLPIQYADYAQWQRGWLQGEALEKQLAYWRARLAGAPAQLGLPTDKARPAARNYAGESLAFTLDASLSAALRVFAKRHDVTLFMVLYAAWSLLLARLSGQDDIVVGTPIANRQRPELESLIGFLINTLALRLEIDRESSIEAFLKQVKDVTLGAYDHQDVPFDQVVEAVQPERSLNRHPLFQAMFALQNAEHIDLRLPDVTVTLEEDAFEYCKFDLVLSLEEQEDRIVGTLSYAKALFERATIERWMVCLKTLLREMTDSVGKRVGELELLPESERRQVLDDFNATQAPYPEDKLLHELFEEQVRRHPQAVAVVHEQQSLTYAELDSRTNQLARYLREKGVGPDRLVGLCLERSVDIVVAIIGTWKAGGAYVPLDPQYPATRLAYMLEDAAPPVVLTQESLIDRLSPTSASTIALDRDWALIAANGDSPLDSRAFGLSSQHLAYVIYTSGSTGHPKGVMVEHRNVISLCQGLEHLYRRSAPCERVGVNASFNFDASVKQLVQVLSGRTLVLVPSHVRADATLLLELIREQRIEGIDCTPSQLRAWIDAGLLTDRKSRLHVVLVGGEAIDSELWRSLSQCTSTDFYNVYGPTESTVDTTAAAVAGEASMPHIGGPMENRQVYLLDRYRKPVPIGVTGEIYIGGAGVARGYLNRPELTAERFLQDALSADGRARVYKSGDLARWRPDGTLEYLGRNDDQVKVRGFRIELGEIEACLARHAQVRDVAVVAREAVPGEIGLVAYFTSRDVPGPSIEALRAHLEAAMPDYMIPGAFVRLEKMPFTPSGKLDRRALPTPGAETFASERYEHPRGEVEKILADLWEDLLRVERVGRYDNFFQLGGHSLSGMKLIAKVAGRLAVRLPAVAVFKYPQLQQLARVIESLRLADSGGRIAEAVDLEEGVL